MKKFLSIIPFVVFCIIKTDAQVINFFTDGSRWIYNTDESFEYGMFVTNSFREQNIIDGDSMINGTNYKMLFTTKKHTIHYHFSSPPPDDITYDSTGPSFIRFDSTLNSVFYLEDVNAVEKKIYDFNQTIGDTTLLIPADFGRFVIDTIEAINLWGLSVKKYVLSYDYIFIPQENYIIEGMGGANGLTYVNPYYPPLGGGVFVTTLECFQHEDSIYSRYGFDTCPFLNYITNVSEKTTSSEISLFPNPSNNYLNITTNLSDNNFINPIHYQIINPLGESVAAGSSNVNGFSVDVSALASGVYFIHIQNNMGNAIKRWVKE